VPVTVTKDLSATVTVALRALSRRRVLVGVPQALITRLRRRLRAGRPPDGRRPGRAARRVRRRARQPSVRNDRKMAHHIHCHIHYGSGSTGDKPTFGSMDEVKHDPHTGQFTAAGHQNAARSHYRKASEHAAKRDQYGSRTNEHFAHHAASFAHANASSKHQMAARDFPNKERSNEATEASHEATISSELAAKRR
jgi:hypothetical protein